MGWVLKWIVIPFIILIVGFLFGSFISLVKADEFNCSSQICSVSNSLWTCSWNNCSIQPKLITVVNMTNVTNVTQTFSNYTCSDVNITSEIKNYINSTFFLFNKSKEYDDVKFKLDKCVNDSSSSISFYREYISPEVYNDTRDKLMNEVVVSKNEVKHVKATYVRYIPISIGVTVFVLYIFYIRKPEVVTEGYKPRGELPASSPKVEQEVRFSQLEAKFENELNLLKEELRKKDEIIKKKRR